MAMAALIIAILTLPGKILIYLLTWMARTMKISNEPFVKIRPDSSGKKPMENWLDTIHIEIENVGYKYAKWLCNDTKG